MWYNPSMSISHLRAPGSPVCTEDETCSICHPPTLEKPPFLARFVANLLIVALVLLVFALIGGLFVAVVVGLHTAPLLTVVVLGVFTALWLSIGD